MPKFSELTPAGESTVTAVIDGDTVTLENGREVRLTGIQSPKLALGRPNFKDWPLADEAKKELEDLVLNQAVTLYLDDRREDRYRRLLAHLVREDGLWLQGTLIERGLARVYTFADNRRMAQALYSLEQTARENRLGMWALDHYAIRPAVPAVLDKDIGTFQIVEGRVLDAAKVRSRIYLNFGSDYRSDFTASIDRESWPLFDDDGHDPLDLEGRTVRVRGWIKDFNGPLIEVTHPEQIEVAAQED